MERISAEEYRKVAKKSGKKPETIIQNSIRDFLQIKGWFVIRHHQGLGSMKGLSDLTAIKNGVTIYIEVKLPNPRSKMSDHQKEFQKNIEEHGGLFLEARSVDQVDEFLMKNGLR